MSQKTKNSSLRTLVCRLLEDKSLGPAMINVNPVVDPSAALTDPTNPNFKPSSKAELIVALQAMVDQLPDENIPDIYDSIKGSMIPKEDEGEKKMNKGTKTEQIIRLAVRKMLSEISKSKQEKAAEFWKTVDSDAARAAFLARGGEVTKLPAGASGKKPGEYGAPPTEKQRAELKKALSGEYLEDKEEKQDKRGYETGDVTLRDLAAEFGFKNPNGVLQWINNNVLPKVRTRVENPELLQVTTLEAIKDYIEELAAATDMPEEEVQLMKDNPDMVGELDSFRIYLKKKLAKVGL